MLLPYLDKDYIAQGETDKQTEETDRCAEGQTVACIG